MPGSPAHSVRFAVATVVCLLMELTLPLLIESSASALVAWAELVVVLAVPFVFGGIVLTPGADALAASRSPPPTART